MKILVLVFAFLMSNGIARAAYNLYFVNYSSETLRFRWNNGVDAPVDQILAPATQYIALGYVSVVPATYTVYSEREQRYLMFAYHVGRAGFCIASDTEFYFHETATQVKTQFATWNSQTGAQRDALLWVCLGIGFLMGWKLVEAIE